MSDYIDLMERLVKRFCWTMVISTIAGILIALLCIYCVGAPVRVEFDPPALPVDGYELQWADKALDIKQATGAVIDASPGDVIKARSYRDGQWSAYSNEVVVQGEITLTPTNTSTPTFTKRPTWAQSPTPRPSRIWTPRPTITEITPTVTHTPSMTPTNTPTPTVTPIEIFIRPETRRIILNFE